MKPSREKSSPFKHLSKDPIMRRLLKEHDAPKWHKSDNLFQDIVENIIGQQLSSRPANIITQRFIDLFPKSKFPAPKAILAVADEKIRACGLSWAKVKYIKNLAQAVSSGDLDLEAIKTKKDEEVIIELTKIKGIGRWTAEMVLIFYLQRPDVFSLGDLGLRTAVSKLYGVSREEIKKIEKISLAWSPYRSYASRYLWMSLDNQ